jgi:tartrate dehydratase alpha subunit/fumarate hydratase class I-like protein
MLHTRKMNVMSGMALVLATTAATPVTYASSDMLQRYQSVCEQNAMCSAEMTPRGLLFKLRMPKRTQQLLCQDDGACDVLASRGGQFRIKDAESWLAAK